MGQLAAATAACPRVLLVEPHAGLRATLAGADESGRPACSSTLRSQPVVWPVTLRAPDPGRVVVTGAAGFIGAHVVRALLAASWSVVAIDCRPLHLAHGEGIDARRLTRIQSDVVTLPLERLVEGAAAVVHLAARAGVGASWAAVADYLRSNAVGTERVAAACVAAGVPRLVLASSSSVYGEAEAFPTSERSQPRPVSPYGVSKLAAEQLALAHARRSGGALQIAALRYFSVYGPGQRADLLISRLLAAARAGTPVQVDGDGTQSRDWTYITDAVAATLAALRRPAACGVFNIAGGTHASVNEVIDRVQRVTGRRIRRHPGPPRPGDVARTEAAIDRARRELGWRPRVGLDEGLAAAWAWLGTDPAASHAPATIDEMGV